MAVSFTNFHCINHSSSALYYITYMYTRTFTCIDANIIELIYLQSKSNQLQQIPNNVTDSSDVSMKHKSQY